MFVFPANDAGYRSRKKAFRACAECKKGRRRCTAAVKGRRCQPCQELNLNCSLVPKQEGPSGSNGDLQNLLYKPKVLEDTSKQRFISLLEPSSDLVMSTGNPDRDRTGIWVNKNDAKPETNPIVHYRKIVVPSVLDEYLLAHLNAMHAFEFPKEPDKTILINIFFDYIYPVLPLVNREQFYKDYKKGDFSIPLVQAIILAACRHGQAVRHIGGTYARNFSAATYRKVKALLYAGIEKNPLTLVQIYALMSLHSEGPDGFSEGGVNLSNAFHHAHSLGIHLSGSNESLDPASSQIWRSIWCLDVLAVNSLPSNTNPPGVGQEITDEGESTTHEFVRRCRILDEVTDLYRPGGRRKIPEYMYNNPPPPDDGTPFTALAQLIHYMSQILCFKRGLATGLSAERIQEILIESTIKVYDILDAYDLCPLPVIPYSVSLTMSVILRYFSLPVTRDLWRRGIGILDRLGDAWWAAEAMHSMARSVFEKLEVDYKQIESAEAIDSQLEDMFLDDMTASFVDQTGLFGEVDRNVVDFWFSDPQGFQGYQFSSSGQPGQHPAQQQTQSQIPLRYPSQELSQRPQSQVESPTLSTQSYGSSDSQYNSSEPSQSFVAADQIKSEP
jgi:Fungal specific transcription factor domain